MHPRTGRGNTCVQYSKLSGGPTAKAGKTKMRRERAGLLEMVVCRGNYLGDCRSSLPSILSLVLTMLTVKVPMRVTRRRK